MRTFQAAGIARARGEHGVAQADGLTVEAGAFMGEKRCKWLGPETCREIF
ncbi:hypothetical protein GCM10010385_41460 [Streptomyces geysiriensis]|nr:hypothetical protein GCM10010385_41460 [Streptomyces geysiriensis]